MFFQPNGDLQYNEMKYFYCETRGNVMYSTDEVREILLEYSFNFAINVYDTFLHNADCWLLALCRLFFG